MPNFARASSILGILTVVLLSTVVGVLAAHPTGPGTASDSTTSSARASIPGQLEQGPTGILPAGNERTVNVAAVDRDTLPAEEAPAPDRLQADAVLVIPSLVSVAPGGSVSVPISLISNGNQVGTATMRIEYDETLLTFNSCTLLVPIGANPYQFSCVVKTDAVLGKYIDVAFTSYTRAIPDGPINTLNFTAASPPVRTVTPLVFITPPTELLSTAGVSVPLTTTNGSVVILGPTPTVTSTPQPTATSTATSTPQPTAPSTATPTTPPTMAITATPRPTLPPVGGFAEGGIGAGEAVEHLTVPRGSGRALGLSMVAALAVLALTVVYRRSRA